MKAHTAVKPVDDIYLSAFDRWIATKVSKQLAELKSKRRNI